MLHNTNKINQLLQPHLLFIVLFFTHMMFLHMEYTQCEHFELRGSSEGGNTGMLEGLFLVLFKCYCEKQM